MHGPAVRQEPTALRFVGVAREDGEWEVNGRPLDELLTYSVVTATPAASSVVWPSRPT